MIITVRVLALITYSLANKTILSIGNLPWQNIDEGIFTMALYLGQILDISQIQARHYFNIKNGIYPRRLLSLIYYTLVYATRALKIYTSIIFSLRAVLQVLEPSLPLLSKSRLERDLLEYNLKATALFTGVLYIAIIIAFRSLIQLLKPLFIIYLGQIMDIIQLCERYNLPLILLLYQSKYLHASF